MSATPPERSPVASPSKTGRRAWSTELVREWALKRYPGRPFFENLRLGPTEAHVYGVTISPAFERMLRVENWYADLVVPLDDSIQVIEAKVKANPGAVGQVLFYSRLVPSTPQLVELVNRPIQPVVLFAEDDTAVSNFARGLGVRVEIYTPPWIEDYLNQVQFRIRSTVPQGA